MSKYSLFLHSNLKFQYKLTTKSNLILNSEQKSNSAFGLLLSCTPIVVLLLSITSIIIISGADTVQDYSYIILLVCAAIGCMIQFAKFKTFRGIGTGITQSARQILPTVPILIAIGTLSASWMLSGVVPFLIHAGLQLLRPDLFLVATCLSCAIISVMTGSSWTTIATVGVAMFGVGNVMGYHPGWIAGAIISGAYFGDKVSPLSDTTVLASSSCGVPLFKHIRFLMNTSIPAFIFALLIFFIAGIYGDTIDHSSHSVRMTAALENNFNLTPWVLAIPIFTFILIGLRVGTSTTMFISTAAGLAGMWLLQPHIVMQLCGDTTTLTHKALSSIFSVLGPSALSTGDSLLDPLVATGGAFGMIPTIILVLSAMTFGGVMIGTGMLTEITHALTSRLSRPLPMVSTTVGSGLFLNACTGDQYLSIIVGGNVFSDAYKRIGLPAHHLSRTLEDSISVTSVLIPWNSCAVTQTAVLGVSTLIYLPFCFFNILSPVCTLVWAYAKHRRFHKLSIA